MFLDTAWCISYPSDGGKRSPSVPHPFPVPLSSETKMRRIFALLLLTPLLANCADSATPVAPAAPAGAALSEGDAPTEAEWPVEENWWTPGDAIEFVEEGMSVQAADVNATANTPKPAVMVLGNPDAGSDFPAGHDQSIHARDRIIPGTVVINAGELVTFQGVFTHRMAIYNDGMKPEDVLNTNPGTFVLYPYNRLYLQPTATPQVTLKFVRPGKFLVICAIKTHFFDRNMWGWVIVR
jgi:plastocyanin